MSLAIRTLLFAALVLGWTLGCGGNSKHHVPVDSPIIKFEPPDPADVLDEDTEGDESLDEDVGDIGSTPQPKANPPAKANPNPNPSAPTPATKPASKSAPKPGSTP